MPVDRALADINFAGTSTLDMYGYPLPQRGYEWGMPRYQTGLIAIGLGQGAP